MTLTVGFLACLAGALSICFTLDHAIGQIKLRRISGRGSFLNVERDEL